MKRLAAVVITGVLLAAAAFMGRAGPTPKPPLPAAVPEACIDQMFEAAERGDVAAYLDCFGGTERARLQSELANQSPDAFAAALVEAVAELQGRATSIEEDDGSRCVVTVERIYLHRTDRQTYELTRDGDKWRIFTVRGTTPRQPRKAYGTPVWE